MAATGAGVSEIASVDGVAGALVNGGVVLAGLVSGAVRAGGNLLDLAVAKASSMIDSKEARPPLPEMARFHPAT